MKLRCHERKLRGRRAFSVWPGRPARRGYEVSPADPRKASCPPGAGRERPSAFAISPECSSGPRFRRGAADRKRPRKRPWEVIAVVRVGSNAPGGEQRPTPMNADPVFPDRWQSVSFRLTTAPSSLSVPSVRSYGHAHSAGDHRLPSSGSVVFLFHVRPPPSRWLRCRSSDNTTFIGRCATWDRRQHHVPRPHRHRRREFRSTPSSFHRERARALPARQTTPTESDHCRRVRKWAAHLLRCHHRESPIFQ